jgi:hypothetical protein
MQEVEQFKWWLPPGQGRKKPYLSSWHMTAEEAAKRGALRPETTSRMVIRRPETAQEAIEMQRRTDTSVWAGAKR